jgi:hypothetical protein
MAEFDQPKKETVRIELPLLPLPNQPQPIIEPRETVRIQLPPHEMDGSSLSSQSSHEGILPTNLFPPPNPPIPSKPLSKPLRASQKKTQSPVTLPQVAAQNRSIDAAAEEKSSMALYWLLLGLSALILIIQIWTYFS